MIDRVASVDRWTAVAGILAVGAFAAAVVALVVGRSVLRWSALVTPLVAVAAMVVVRLTASVVRWTQLGLDAVMVGDGFRGYRMVGDEHARFVLSGTTMRSPAEAERMVDIHLAASVGLVVALALTAVLGVLALLPARSSRPSPGESSAAVPGETV